MPQMELPQIDLFSLVMPAAGVYLLWIAIFGKAKMLRNEYPKCSPEKYRFWMRILSAVSGVLLIVKGVLEIFNIAPTGSVLNTVLWVLGLVSLIGLMVFSAVMTDREKARAAAEEEAKKRGGTTVSGTRMPESAFSFEQEETPAEPETEEQPGSEE